MLDTNQPVYRRNRKTKFSATEALMEAHKIAFYPLLFECVRAMLEFGLLPSLLDTALAPAELQKKCAVSEYALTLMLDVAEYLNILETVPDGKYRATKLGRILATDTALRVNMDFMHDVCYLGAFRLTDSLRSGRPEGLRFLGDWPTIYDGLAQLPARIQQSWFAFDNYYSDLVFDHVVRIVLAAKPGVVFDVGGNTAKFDIALLQADPAVRSEIFDLPGQLAKAGQNLQAAGLAHRVTLHACNVLAEDTEFPPQADAIFMSQFLDCFSRENIALILRKVRSALKPAARFFILEPFIDQQPRGAAVSLLAISLYFTCMANGYSRMYRQTDFTAWLKEAGFQIIKAHQGLGEFDYTLLECAVADAR
ncbi:MAG: SAM-dependent methyltransferase [Candidatus Margulisbacteria bacterium]|jgi:hypothetical protein|nr:SAM-dependent methyltransferase [Candidatus Margulisiibacteriota bacterium]